MIFLGIVLLFFSMALIFGFILMSNINDEAQLLSFLPARATDATQTLTNQYSGIMDNSFLFLAIGMALVTLVLAAMVRVHPIFIPFFIIGLIIVIFFSGIFSNIYQEVAADSQVSTYSDQLTFVSLVMEFLPFIVGIFGTILMVVMYKLNVNASET